MNTTTQKTLIEVALAKLSADPKLAYEFDRAAMIEAPGKKRAEAVALALDALAAKRAAYNATKQASVAKKIAGYARTKLAQAVAPLKGRPDKRQGALPLNRWHLVHLMAEAKQGNTEAAAELSRRGYIESAGIYHYQTK
jgi:hypothetical protein